MGVRWRRSLSFGDFSPGNSFSLASFIGSCAPSSLPHHILRLHVIMKTLPSPFICPLPSHLPSFQGWGLQEDIWQVWRWLWGKYRRSGAGHTHQGSWVGNPLLIILLPVLLKFGLSDSNPFPNLFNADWTRLTLRWIRSRKKLMRMETGKLTLKNSFQ